MVLFGIIGELGAGKTLALTFLAWHNWMRKNKKIYSNYKLFKIPYVEIGALSHLDTMRDGFACIDEFWTLIDARTTTTKRNKLVADILLKSRKRELTYTFTTQMLDLLDKRVRKIMDFTAYPVMNTQETLTKILIFRTGYPKKQGLLKTFYFKNQLVYQMFNTNQEIQTVDESDKPPRIMFQEEEDKEPIIFDTWKEANEHGERYWNDNIEKFAPLILNR